jgi:hypothetical protein
MKPSTLLLAGSIAANAALLALFVAGLLGEKTSNAVANPGSTTAAATKSTTPAASTTAWSALQPRDLPQLADRLRVAGFPPAVIRAMLTEQVKASFAARRSAALRDAPNRRFWEPAAPDPKTAVALAQLDKEEKQALRDLLGPEIALDDPAFHQLRRQLPGLPVEKLLALHLAQQTYREKRQELSLAGVFGTAALDTLDKEQRAEIVRLFTPEELEEYDLRIGTTANSLRYRLAGVDVTEQEFRALHRLQKAFDEQHGGVASLLDLPAEQRTTMLRQRSESQRQLEAQIKATFGESRYADYQRVNDGNFRQTAQLVTRLGLPPATTDQVQALQKDLQARANALQSDRALAPEDRNSQLAGLATEARTRLGALLGTQGFEAYTLTGGTWMRQLEPRPAPTAGRAGAGASGGRGRGGG